MSPPIVLKHIGDNGCGMVISSIDKGNSGTSIRLKDIAICSNCGKTIEAPARYITKTLSHYDN
jgi:hypothetical protein